ncbi:MAG: DUF1292 domain-containing protein [Clostridia bacterium]|nr:DUF1292 domain-containing protein [Clostridia bacterium]
MEQEYNPDILTLTDEDGKEFSFELLDSIETDEGRYVALMPTYQTAEELLSDSGELVILKVTEVDGEDMFDEITDDDEYDTIADCFIDRLQDLFEIDVD